jgi:hypothetical protein
MSSNCESLTTTLKRNIEILSSLIKLLENKLDEIEKYSLKRNATKTVSTVVSSAGAAIIVGSLILAPITGGASIVAATGWGAALSVTGTMMDLTVEILNIAKSKEFMDSINEQCTQRMKLNNDLNFHLDNVAKLKSELNIEDENESYYTAFSTYIKSNKMKIYGVKGAVDLSKKLSRAKGLSSFALRNGGSYWKNIRIFSQSIKKNTASLGVQISSKTAMRVARNATIGVNVIFTAYDIYSCIESWRKEDDLVKN